MIQSRLAAVLLLLALPIVALGALGGPTNDNKENRRNLVFSLFNTETSHFFGARKGKKATSNYATNCVSNKDCEDNSYCAAGQCLTMGSCETEWDCRNPSNSYAIIECVGPILCDKKKECRRECGPLCPDGSFGVECDVDPCSVANETCRGNFTSCQTESCGGCSALVFDDTGKHELCTEKPKTPCTSTTDCGDWEYCSNGVCTESGKCSSDADCFNPENIYATILCIGPVSCDKQLGQCGRTCSDSDCPDGQAPTQCLVAPCDVIESPCKDEVASCVDSYCGGCNAYAFDKAGYQVCKGNPSDSNNPSGSDEASCSSAKDCAQDEYCAGGECLPDGQCNADIDCRNPDNMYALAACVGVIGCYEGGTCGIECGGSFCPPGSVEAKCMTSPCASPPKCQESWEYCIDDTCNGECGVILLDAAGNEVTCTPV